MWKFNGDDKKLSIADRSDRFIYPLLVKSNLRFFSSNTWESVPGTKMQMEDWESATSMRLMPVQ